MNYTINYSSSGLGHVPVTVPSQGNQRTIVLTPPSQACQGNASGGGTNTQMSFPMVMQIGTPSAPIIYAYQNPEGIINTHIANTSPVQSGINVHANNNSPTIPSVIQCDTKAGAARSLNDLFGMQSVNSIPNAGAMLQSGNIPVIQNSNLPQNSSNNDIASLISSLQAAGVQLVEPQVEEAKIVGDNNIMPVSNNAAGVEKYYKIIDGEGNVTVIATAVNDSKSSDLKELPVVNGVTVLNEVPGNEQQVVKEWQINNQQALMKDQQGKQDRDISWCKWISRNGKSAPDKCQINGSLKQGIGIDELMEIVSNLKAHIFRSNWHRNLFEYIRRNMLSGYVVQIFDFAMNYRNTHQDEVQSAYWDGTQTSIHAIINYFLCPQGCSEVVTLIIAQITDDLKHDSFVARAGHDAAFWYLAEIGVPMELVMQFCDNCGSQYKSPFAEMARCPLNLIRIFFGEKHGKSHCDGFFGCLKSWMSHKIKSRQVIVNDAHDFYRCCKEEYETNVQNGQCQHYRVKFQYLRPSDIRRHHDCDLDNAIPGTHNIYSVWNTDQPLQLKVRNVPCLCLLCILDDGQECVNNMYTDKWRQVVPVKGDSKKKHMKRKHLQECIKSKTFEDRHLCDEEESGDEELPDIVIQNAEDNDDVQAKDKSAIVYTSKDIYIHRFDRESKS